MSDYDFSAFDGDKDKKKSDEFYDFSSFDSHGKKPEAESTTAGHAALLGAAQGASFNNADELGAFAGALGDRSVANNQGLLGASGEAISALPGLLGITNPDNNEFIKSYHNILPEVRQDFKTSEQEHPYASMGGNVGGALLSGKLIAGALPAAAKGTTLAKGVAGPINQASALQNISNAAQVGGMYGAASGAGNSEADLSQGQYGQLAKDTEVGALIGAGTGGVLQGAGEGLKATGRAVANSEIGQNISHAFSRGKEGVNLITKGAPEQDVLNLADRVINTDVKELSETVINEYNKAKQTGKPDAEIIQVLKDKYLPVIKELNNDPSTQGKAVELLNVVQDIVEGKPKLVSANARVFSPGKAIQQDAIPSAQSKLDALKSSKIAQSQALGEPGNLSVVPVGEDKSLLGLLDSEKGKFLKTLPNEPAVPASTTYTPGEVSTKTTTGFVRSGGKSELAPADLVELEKKTGSQSYNLGRPGTDSRVQEVAKSLDEAVTEATNENVPGIAKARGMRSTQGAIEDTLKPDNENAVGRLIGKIENYGKDLQTKNEVDALLENINKIDPNKAAELKTQITTLSKDLDVNKSINQTGLFPKDLAGKIGAVAGGAIGKSGLLTTGIGAHVGKKFLNPYTIANASGRTLRAISSSTPDQVKNLASSAIQTSSEVGQRVGNILNSIADAPFEKRNAVLFSLQQNAAYRQFLREHFQMDENE